MLNIKDLQSRIVEELDMAHLSEEDQELFVDSLGSMLYQRMMLAVYDKIPAEEHEKLKQLISADLEDEITAMISKHVPDLEDIIQKELDESIKEFREALAKSAV